MVIYLKSWITIIYFLGSLFTISRGQTFHEYIVDSQSKMFMQLTFRIVNDQDIQIVGCKLRPSSPRKLSKMNDANVHYIDHGSLIEAEKLCVQFSSGDFALSNLIYPGTKWCGSGNSARNIDDLGLNRKADSCCRTHDFCPDVIRPGQTKHGLHNSGPVTISHCKCDVKFHQCLAANANDIPSNIISQLYFNVIKMKCFQEEHPVVGCLKFKGKRKQTCQEYQLDYSKLKLYQFFQSAQIVPQN